MFLFIIRLNHLFWLQYIVIVSQLFHLRKLFHIFMQHTSHHIIFSYSIYDFYAWKFTVFI